MPLTQFGVPAICPSRKSGRSRLHSYKALPSRVIATQNHSTLQTHLAPPFTLYGTQHAITDSSLTAYNFFFLLSSFSLLCLPAEKLGVENEKSFPILKFTNLDHFLSWVSRYALNPPHLYLLG